MRYKLLRIFFPANNPKSLPQELSTQQQVICFWQRCNIFHYYCSKFYWSEPKFKQLIFKSCLGICSRLNHENFIAPCYQQPRRSSEPSSSITAMTTKASAITSSAATTTSVAANTTDCLLDSWDYIHITVQCKGIQGKLAEITLLMRQTNIVVVAVQKTKPTRLFYEKEWSENFIAACCQSYEGTRSWHHQSQQWQQYHLQ